jgi:hypothetical protein
VSEIEYLAVGTVLGALLISVIHEITEGWK